ncbi:hypothetical protein [Leptospira interrogans]|uniref:hypothetical protein n=2 Tax=Leptospira interrogans TaxID=173 RepID=UPI00034D6EB1|nr:hypothetical protein [Leptospira interrogans]
MKLKFFKIHFLFLNFMAGAVLRYHTHYIVKTLEETAFQKLLQWLSDRKVQDFVNIQRTNLLDYVGIVQSQIGFNHRHFLKNFGHYCPVLTGFYISRMKKMTKMKSITPMNL